MAVRRLDSNMLTQKKVDEMHMLAKEQARKMVGGWSRIFLDTRHPDNQQSQDLPDQQPQEQPVQEMTNATSG